MQQPATILEKGTKIRTHKELGTTKGMGLSSAILENRQPDAVGAIRGPAPGLGGDVYLVDHNENIAAYCWDEFELEAP